MHVEAPASLAGEAIVSALIMSLIGANWHHLLVFGLAGYDREFWYLLYHLSIVELVSFAASHSRVHLL